MGEGVSFQFEGQPITRGVYAVLESSTYEPRPESAYQSDMFRPLNKHGAEMNNDGTIKKRRFWLTDVDAFHEQICVIGDFGLKGWESHSKVRYLHVERRSKWASCFLKWVNANHEQDHMEDDEEEDAQLEGSEEEESDSDEEEESDEEANDDPTMGRL